MEEVFEPITENQKQSQNQTELESGKQIQALRDSTQTTTQAIQGQTRVIRELSNALNKNSQKSNKERIEYDEITNRNNQVLTNLVKSNTVNFSIVRTVSNLLNDKNRSQYSLEPEEGYSNLLTINPNNPQLVQVKGSTLTYQNGNTNILNDPDLSYFISIAQLDSQPQNLNLINNLFN